MRASVVSRFLGFSYGEILGTTVAAVVLLGPKDVPMLAKSLGRMTGKIVGYSHVYREKLPFDFGIGGGSGKNQKLDRATKRAGSSTWEKMCNYLLEIVVTFCKILEIT